MLWILLLLLLFLWIIRFGLGLGGLWISLAMVIGWFYFFSSLFVGHEHN